MLFLGWMIDVILSMFRCIFLFQRFPFSLWPIFFLILLFFSSCSLPWFPPYAFSFTYIYLPVPTNPRSNADLTAFCNSLHDGTMICKLCPLFIYLFSFSFPSLHILARVLGHVLMLMFLLCRLFFWFVALFDASVYISEFKWEFNLCMHFTLPELQAYLFILSLGYFLTYCSIQFIFYPENSGIKTAEPRTKTAAYLIWNLVSD